ncbi:transketolase [Geobacillus thermodenitrificans]|jgi:transketolase|uniref:transketolase n=1 Tax=Geobacillus thermodenitrificans TaxID=33940 RepID=UPI00042A5000|nr:transketolase [Geobacillus thermodenitrificans]ARA96698.1 transketolase [Geobacillus thermodenitrificans]MED3907465.1 transketolase [Geobacillus thermodenitrificans]PJW20744.1 transketolase [Geobacillus thermodenitrificans]
MNDLERFRDKIRLWTLKQLNHLGFGHYGGSLSIVEVLAVLYGKIMNISPGQMNDEHRDRFVLSKGHGGPALYAALAIKGFFPYEMLYTLNQNGTKLPSHPDRNLTPGVEMTTGSLGQGISVAVGIALSQKLSNIPSYTYTIVGDGELNEGQCWEAIQFAAHHKLHRLFVFVDDNKKQLDGWTKDICDPIDFVEKFRSFGFWTCRVNGASLEEIEAAILEGKKQSKKPVAIILDTIKGQGVPYLEQKEDNHHIRPSAEDQKAIEEAILELEQKCSSEEVNV